MPKKENKQDQDKVLDQEEIVQDDSGTTGQDDATNPEIAILQKKLIEQEEITKRAQSDYFRLKLDMDAYITRAEETKKKERVDALVSMGGKLLPFVTQLEQSIQHMPETIAADAWSEGLQLIHQKALADLATLGIVPIVPELGTDPDLTLHLPINMQEVEDETQKGKIVQVIESGRNVEKNGMHQVIVPAKIIVGS